MRLLVDIIPYDQGNSGISAYAKNVIDALSAAGHNITLLTEPGVGKQFFPEFESIEAPGWTRRAAFSMLWHLFFLPRRLASWQARFDGFIITAANRRVCCRYPLPTTATVHDLANFHIPGKYSRLRMFYLAKILPYYAKRSPQLIAISHSTANDMMHYWGVSEESIQVLYNGLCAIPHPSNRLSWISNNGLTPGGYLLYVSRIEHPGKNHVKLIDAFSRLERDDLQLVLAGKEWKDAEAVKAAAMASPAANRIHFTGFLDNLDLAEAYRGAAVYVFPSLFEGFGLSLLEAMAEGTPCACSNNGALGEIAGDVAETFNPNDSEDMSRAISRLLNESPEDKRKRHDRGIDYAATFTWQSHALGIIECLEKQRENAKVTRLFGIPIVRTTQEGFTEALVGFAKGPRNTPKYVATVNVDFITNAVATCGFKGNPELWNYLKQADYVTADGMPIVLLSKLKRQPLPERVTGSDMVPELAARFADEGLSFYVLGGEEPTLSEALAILHDKHPALKIAGTDTSRVPLDDCPENDAIIERINKSNADLLFVALGNPKQELWMGRYAKRLHVPVMVGVGGTFNFIAGRVKRAPRWMQKCGLEWVWRVVVEPRRLWKRYAFGLFKFSIVSIKELFGGSDDVK
ncbi:MAG: WecB/TagA/CpsF family glycosyltransferase [Victivallales bacterium]|nr:WecB/TagA/CpsF family glycosyltransferase [Victivallales bacterium]